MDITYEHAPGGYDSLPGAAANEPDEPTTARRSMLHVELSDATMEGVRVAADSFQGLTVRRAKDFLAQGLAGWLTANQAEVYRLIRGEVIRAREAELARLREEV